MKIGHWVVLGVCIFVLFLWTGCTESENNDKGDDFSFTTLDNNINHLRDYRDKVVILDMWATWCTPCAYQMIELQKAYDHYEPEDLEILSIDIDSREGLSDIQQFMETLQNTYGVTLDWIFGMDDGAIWSRYQISGAIPTLCIFDQEGNLIFSHEGVCIFDELPLGYPEDLTRLRPILDDLFG